MGRNIKFILLGLVAFVFASAMANVLGLLVNAIIPNPNKPDPPGNIEPDPQVKAKEEWEKQQKDQGIEAESKTQETQTEQTTEATTQQAPPQAPEPSQPAPPPYTPPVPRAPVTGPGDFDAPQYSPPPPVYRTGPGNM